MTELIKAISDHGNIYASKIIIYLGWGGAGVTGVNELSKTEMVKGAIPSAERMHQACSEDPTWLIYVPAVLAAVAIVKLFADIHFRKLEHKKIMNEKRTDTDNLC